MKIPCEECISFAICKQKVRQWTEPADITCFANMIECDKIKQYMGNCTSGQIDNIRLLYGLCKVQDIPHHNRGIAITDTRINRMFKLTTNNLNDSLIGKNKIW